VTLDSSQTRKDWMTETAGNVYGDKLQTLIRSTNFIKSLEEAEAEKERERAFILQQQHTETFLIHVIGTIEQAREIFSFRLFIRLKSAESAIIWRQDFIIINSLPV
jgi:hypothetical protein